MMMVYQITYIFHFFYTYFFIDMYFVIYMYIWVYLSDIIDVDGDQDGCKNWRLRVVYRKYFARCIRYFFNHVNGVLILWELLPNFFSGALWKRKLRSRDSDTEFTRMIFKSSKDEPPAKKVRFWIWTIWNKQILRL